MKKIVLYSTGCPKCKVLKEKLNLAKIQYIEENDVEKMLSMGIQTVPVLGVGEELMDFMKSVEWIGENNK